MTRVHRRAMLRTAGLLGVSSAGLALLDSCGLVPSLGSTRVPRLGYLASGPPETAAVYRAAFVDGLSDLGYVEGKTITIEWRFTPADRDAEFFPALAAELVRFPVDAIAAYATPAARAAKQATSAIPIIAIAIARSVETGLVASLARPGGNLTGVAAQVSGTLTKQLDLLREVVPGLVRLAVLVDANSPSQVAGWEEIQPAAEKVGVYAERIDVRTAADVERAFDAAALSRADGVIIDAQPVLQPVAARVAELALQHRLPGISGVPDYVGAGLLMAYTPDFLAIHRRAAVYVDKILKGTKPADLPIEQPSVYNLVSCPGSFC